MNVSSTLDQTPLGVPSPYPQSYDASQLYSLDRSMTRRGIDLSFCGVDLWTAYEMSWLNPRGMPKVAVMSASIPCESPRLIESKSLKLYLNSFNQSRFESGSSVREVLQRDLARAVGAPVSVVLYRSDQWRCTLGEGLGGESLDGQDLAITTYDIDASLLSAGPSNASETLYSDLLKSHCLKTGQPDWASVWFRYRGAKLDRAGLLKYVISFRNHAGFHEDCVERMYTDIMTRCHPEQLTVYARYTRRGGVDINPFRSNYENAPHNIRTARQ